MARHRHELSDAEWAVLEPLLPARKTAGRHYQDHRRVLNGMLFRVNAGLAWRDLPQRYGPWQTVYSRYRRWSRSGLWDRLLQALHSELDAAGRLDWSLWCIDGSNVRAHKAAAGGGKKASGAGAEGHALGRSRGGWGTKLHLVVDGAGLPLAVHLSAGQASEAVYAEPLLEAVRINRPSGTVRQRPERVAGDKGYSHRRIRRWLRQRHIRAVIPERRDQVARRRGRPPQFDAQQYRRRNVVERCVGWLKEARAVATRFEKLALHYLGTIKLAMIRRCLRATLSNRP
ncbi:IS5 family transposase [Aquabacterium sp. A7-Y]|uniref:IS5 family transposase n=1 Tax=Aquabacterium sp. A7-Y TaxID=1349605 RepID=UPI0039FD7E1A